MKPLYDASVDEAILVLDKYWEAGAASVFVAGEEGAGRLSSVYTALVKEQGAVPVFVEKSQVTLTVRY